MLEEQNAKIASERKLQVGTGDRSERIRTYNYPQGRLTDHRIGLTLYRLEAILNGDLDEVVDALRAYDQAEKLKSQGAGIKMDTQILKIASIFENPDELQQAADILARGGLVAFPTETVYGLGANGLDEEAVRSIYQAKGRPSDNPLILHICDTEMLPQLAREIPKAALKLALEFWPGPLTMVLPKTEQVPDVVSGGLDTVAIRFPSNLIARELIRRSGKPIAAPSANLSGSPSPTTAQHCIDDLMGRVDAIVDGGSCGVGLESTVISLAGEIPTVLRPGE